MNNPGASTATIGDLIPKVQAALQNRTDVTETQPNPEMRPSAWIRDSLLEITNSNPFEELRQPNPPNVTIGPRLGVGGSTYKYLVSQYVNAGDDVTLIEDPVIFIDPPGNTISYPMDYKTPKAITTLLNITGGIPYYYTRFGTQFWFGTQPGQNFTTYLPYQLRHTFIDSNLPLSPVGVPAGWFDIIGYAAAERGAIALRWNEQAVFLHTMLYGDEKYPVGHPRHRPGLIESRLFQQEMDRRSSTFSVTPSVQRI
jgi:hypothetical protein